MARDLKEREGYFLLYEHAQIWRLWTGFGERLYLQHALGEQTKRSLNKKFYQTGEKTFFEK